MAVPNVSVSVQAIIHSPGQVSEPSVCWAASPWRCQHPRWLPWAPAADAAPLWLHWGPLLDW